MTKQIKSKSIAVLMNGIPVGTLTKASTGVLSFQYEHSWLATDQSRPVSLSLPLRAEVYNGEVVYHFFDNLLPDSDRIRARIQQRFQLASTQPFDLLEAIGYDCVGALQICDPGRMTNLTEIVADPLTDDDIERILSQYHLNPLGMEGNQSDFRISIAGAQEKTALLWHRNRWWRPKGVTPSSHIFKLPIGKLVHHNLDLSESCENEWLCLQIAKAYGLRAANAEILRFGRQKALVVERFDRKWSKDGGWLIRLPQEDMCQALGISSNLKYQSDGGPDIARIMKLLLGSFNAHEDRREFFKSIVFFWLLAAPDGHAKNFSIQILPGGRFSLTPIYDILSFYPYISSFMREKEIKMAMALRGKSNHYHWTYLQKRHFASTAVHSGFSPDEALAIVRGMLEITENVVSNVRRLLPTDFPKDVSEPILDRLLQLARSQMSTES
ncbi:MAG: type II toxin-antitoxin system HipA family toxin [Oligoflexales bacterium]|nr:type II toxin-antitoxin system HipA family toxin [Oligoflexales bacterium]